MARHDAPIRGARAEAKFLLCCLNRGWEIAKPVFDINPYDFLLKRPDKPWQTVQVKTAYIDCGRKVVSIRRRRNGKNVRYALGDFDLLCAVDHDSADIWLIPFRCLQHLGSSIGLSRGCEQFLLGDSEPNLDDVETMSKSLKEAVTEPGNRKLTNEQIRAIRLQHDQGVTQRRLSKEFHTSQSNIGRIIRREIWSKI